MLDARDPNGTRCRHLEQHLKKNAKHKHLLLLLNKCDLVSGMRAGAGEQGSRETLEEGCVKNQGNEGQERARWRIACWHAVATCRRQPLRLSPCCLRTPPHHWPAPQVPAWVTKRWLHWLSREYPTLAFHASITNPFGKGSLLSLLRQLARLRTDKQVRARVCVRWGCHQEGKVSCMCGQGVLAGLHALRPLLIQPSFPSPVTPPAPPSSRSTSLWAWWATPTWASRA